MKYGILFVAVLASIGPAVFGSELFVANYSGNRWDVEAFRSTDSGNAYPQRSISGAGTLMDWPWGVAVDSQRIYVANYTAKSTNLVTIYNSSDNGSNVTPERTISTEIGTLGRAIVVAGTSIIVGTATSGILTFPIDASGVTIPTCRIYGQEIGMDNLGGMAADADYIYAGIYTDPGLIHVFRRTDNGIVAPLRTIRCSAYNLRNVGAMAVDASCLYVLSDPGTTTNLCIMVFDKTANGDVMPLRRIKGANTGISDPMGIAVDENYIYITSRDRNRIQAFSILADGNATPHHVISPEYPNPNLYAPYGIAVNPGSQTRDSLIGPSITADGIRGAIAVAYPTPITLAIAVNAGQYAGVPVDWFAVAIPESGGEWYYLNSSAVWTGFTANNLAACHPALQCGLMDIAQPQIILENYSLPPGKYNFYFILEYPLDGVLNPIPGQYLSDTVRVEVLNQQ